MTSLSIGEQEKDLFIQNEPVPPANFQQSENLNGHKSMQRVQSTSSSLNSATLPNQQQPVHRSLSSHDLITSSHISSLHIKPNRFNKSLTEQFFEWEKEYNKRLKQMNEIKSIELNKFKLYYETKLNELEDNNRQLEITSGQIEQENRRLKIELDHERQRNKIEETSLEQHLKEFKNHLERKIAEVKSSYENEKHEIKQQNSRIYQDLLDDTNQRLKQMENSYKHQQCANETMIEEMEKRLIDLNTNVQNLQQMKFKLEEDKMHLIRTNEQLQLQVQELINKQRHIDRHHADKIQHYENELKSINLRCESNIDLLRKENEVLKTKSSQIIDDLEGKLSTITEEFHHIEKSYENKFRQQQLNYNNNLKHCHSDYEKKLQLLKQELKEHNNKYLSSMKHIEQLQAELRQVKRQMNIDLENQIQEMHNQMHQKEQKLINKLQSEHEKANQQDQEKLREYYGKEIEDMKNKYEQMLEKKDEILKNEIEKFDRICIDTKRTHEIEKQQVINQYEQYIRQLETNYAQNNEECEKRIEKLIAKTQEQVKTMEDEFEMRIANQQILINEQKNQIQSFKDEENRAKTIFEKQCRILSEQSLREKNEIKGQFDQCIKSLEKNFSILASKKEQLERKLSNLKEQHKNELMEYRLAYENNLKGLLSNDVRLDLENTIYSLKQQVVYLQQRISFLQNELEQYIQLYGHRPTEK